MKLEPYNIRWAAIVTSWIGNEDNEKWLQFGSGTQKLDPISFRIISQKADNDFHIYFDENSKQPLGLVALCDLDTTAKTATLWYLPGEDTSNTLAATSKAVHECLRYGFHELKLKSIYAWTVTENTDSISILENNHFNYIGRRRRCQPYDGTLQDRLLYDLLATEFWEYHYEGEQIPLRHHKHGFMPDFDYSET